MAKEVKKAGGVMKPAGNGDYEAIIDSNGENLNALMKANEAMFDGMAAVSHEMMEFANERLRRNLERSETLMHCADVEEAFRVQCEFAHSATREYLQEANKLMSLAAKMTEDWWAPLEDRTKETLHQLSGR